jgi:hypothetical protein
MYQQILDPVADSLAWSAVVAAIPLLLLFVMLGALKVTAWVASLISLAVSIVIAIVDIFRRVILWSPGFLVLLCILSGLQASPVLSWMVRDARS